MKAAGDREAEVQLHRDKQLVDRLLAGDRQSLDRLFEEHARGLVRFALKRLDGDLDAAHDVVQTTLCNAVSGIETYRGEASLFTWLCTCCHYEILRLRKRRARRPLTTELDEAVQPAAGWPRRDDGPERVFADLEMKERVHLTLDRLPADYGTVLEWKYIEEVSVDEIATRLGITPKAAESRLTRARSAFRRSFASTAADPGLWGELRKRMRVASAGRGADGGSS